MSSAPPCVPSSWSRRARRRPVRRRAGHRTSPRRLGQRRRRALDAADAVLLHPRGRAQRLGPGRDPGLHSMRPTVFVENLGRLSVQPIAVIVVAAAGLGPTALVFGWTAPYAVALVVNVIWAKRLLRKIGARDTSLDAPRAVHGRSAASRDPAGVLAVHHPPCVRDGGPDRAPAFRRRDGGRHDRRRRRRRSTPRRPGSSRSGSSGWPRSSRPCLLWSASSSPVASATRPRPCTRRPPSG